MLLIALGAGGCGVTDKGPNTPASAGEALRGDGDTDSPIDRDNDLGSGDQDNDIDGRAPSQGYDHGYYDYDDIYIRTTGHPASASDRRAITALILRYYKAASAGDGAAACTMIYPIIARTLPEEYGGASGPTYLRGASTCQAVMSLLFKHFHNELAATTKIVDVRMVGQQALVMVGSSTMPASMVSVERGGTGWKVDTLIGNRLK